MTAVDPIKSPDNWTFKTPEIANDFDSHVNAHLPWYPLASQAVALAVRQFLPEGGTVFEIGCSNGNIARLVKPTIDARDAAFIGVDSSGDMFDAIRGDFAAHRFLFQHADATDYEIPVTDVFVSMLTSIFISPEGRRRIFDTVWDQLPLGGAMIFVERFAQSSGEHGQLLNRMTLDSKRRAGVSDEQIAAKEFSLVGVQRPIEVDEIPGKPKTFFQFGDFIGAISIKV